MISVLHCMRVTSDVWHAQSETEWDTICQTPHTECADKQDVPLWTFGRASHIMRRASSLSHATALVYDFDAKQGVRLETIDNILATFGLASYLHTTHSHTDTQHAFRVIVRVTHDIPADLYKQAWRAAAQVYGLAGGDPTACSISRIYYVPSCRPGAPRYASYGGSVSVDWEDAIRVAQVEDLPQTKTVQHDRICRDSIDLDRAAALVAIRTITEHVSPDTDMGTWLRAIFAAAEAIGLSEGVDMLEDWSKRGRKYDPRQFVAIRRRLGIRG